MSLIGTLEQINLMNVLQRVEAYAKTGLCVIRQGMQWVELYFGEGRLICSSPVRADITLGERLVEAGIISPQALQAALGCMGAEEFSEMRLALTLLDLGYVDRETLRAWATQQIVEMLRLLFTWTTGDIYFEEHVAPPSDRLLVALPITSLLSAATDASASSETARPISRKLSVVQEQQETVVSTPILRVPTLVDASQFFTVVSPAVSSPNAQESQLLRIELADTVSLTVPASFQQRNRSLSQEQGMVPVMPKLIDTSFMQPNMVLVPADLSALSEQNPQITLTPEQWQIFARADSQTSLHMVCQALGWRPEIVCRVAGELMVEGLLHVVPPIPEYVQELSLTAQTFALPHVSGALPDSGTRSVSQPLQLNIPVAA